MRVLVCRLGRVAGEAAHAGGVLHAGMAVEAALLGSGWAPAAQFGASSPVHSVYLTSRWLSASEVSWLVDLVWLVVSIPSESSARRCRCRWRRRVLASFSLLEASSWVAHLHLWLWVKALGPACWTRRWRRSVVVPSLEAPFHEHGPYLQVVRCGSWRAASYQRVDDLEATLVVLTWRAMFREVIVLEASRWVPTSVLFQDLGEHPHPRRCGVLRSRAREQGAPFDDGNGRCWCAGVPR